MKDSVLKNRSFAFAVRIVEMTRWLQREQKEHVISKQMLRSGTAVGALINEAEFGQSKADFVSKMSIALKEANETSYWLKLLNATGIITNQMAESMLTDCKELIAMLVSTVKTAKTVNSEK